MERKQKMMQATSTPLPTDHRILTALTAGTHAATAPQKLALPESKTLTGRDLISAH